MEIQHIIGIDPSFKTMGVAIKNLRDNSMSLKGGTFSNMIKWINNNADLTKSVAVIEDSNLVSTTFHVWGFMKKEIDDYLTYEIWKRKRTFPIPEQKTMVDLQKQYAIGQKYGQSVGKNKAASSYIITLFDNKNIPIVIVNPSKRDRAEKIMKRAGTAKVNWLSASMPTKMDAKQFGILTGYTGISNEHSRDAATMIFDKDLKWAQRKVERILSDKTPKSYPSSLNDNNYLVKRNKM